MEKRINEDSFYSPVTVQESTNETEEQFLSRWNKFDSLPESVKNKLSYPKTSGLIKNIGTFFSLSQMQVASISRAIRNFYFGDKKIDDFANIFSQEMKIDLNTAQKIAQQVIQNIINDDSFEKAYQANIEKLPLQEAIKKYPEAGEQLITSQKIELKNFHEPVRPSIKNWLQDYVYLLGYQNHDAIERGNYLFHTTNTRRLPDSDREKLAYILKAFDEKFPITVDKEKQQIIFNFPPKTAPINKPSSAYSTVNNNDKLIQPTNRFAPASRPAPSPVVITRPPLPKGEDESARQFSQTNQPRKSQIVPPDAYEAYTIKKQESEQKLSAGKIFSASDNNSNIQETKFDFPQRMPFEKEKEGSASSEDMQNPAPLSPYRISSSATRDTTVKSQPPIHPNNVIDLKNPKS